jgi:hypothetical protein
MPPAVFEYHWVEAHCFDGRRLLKGDALPEQFGQEMCIALIARGE